MKSLTLFNQPIRIGEDDMICLTDMWKASGKSESESPYHYLRNKQTKEFLYGVALVSSSPLQIIVYLLAHLYLYSDAVSLD